MEPMVLFIWFSCLAIGLAGLANLFSGKLLTAVAINSVAAGLTIWIFIWLEPPVVVQLVSAGGFASSVFVAPVVMWAMLVGAAGIHWARQSRRKAAT